MYVLMVWVIVFAVQPLMENLSADGLFWLAAGGAAYMLGALLYNIDKLKFNHAIFHIFVLIGSYCHFHSIYNFRSEEHTSELQSRPHLVCRLLLEKKKHKHNTNT